MIKKGIYKVYKEDGVVVAPCKERESVAEKLLCRRVNEAGGLCLKYGTNGMPDRIVILGGVVSFIELKRPGGKPRSDQMHCIEKLQRAGADVRVLAGSKEVEAWCSEQGV